MSTGKNQDNMKKALFMLAVFVSTALTISLRAQDNPKEERKIALWGHVRDNVTRIGIDNTFITLMTSDSTVVDTTRVFGMGQWDGGTKYDVGYRFQVPARPQKYIIRAEHPEYETLDINFEVKRVARNTFFDAPWHLMKKKPTQAELMERMLDEVTIRATKVKMVYKGDTIVYNADAFNLPEGSMLDALIRQLDGVELKDDGRILVNGEQIDELLLNGKDFFKDNKTVLLDNLPSYTVKNVMVHHKSTDRSEWLGRDDEKKLYVMDVVLKREYAQGWIANVELAGGTPFGERDAEGNRFDERYLARLFALRYTDNSRFTAFFNTNNVNESRRPGSNGEWSPSNQPQGERSTRNAGLDLLIDEKDKRWKENVTIDFSWSKTRDVTLTSTEQFFASSSSTYSRMLNNSLSHDNRLGIRNRFELKQPFWLGAELRFGYFDNDSHGGSRYANMLTDPEYFGTAKKVLDEAFSASLNPDLQAALVNKSHMKSKNDGNGINSSMSIDLTHKLPTGDQIGFELLGSLNNHHSYSYDSQAVDYYRTGQPRTLSNRHTHSPNNSSTFTIGPFYDITWLNGWSLRTAYGYNRAYYHQTRDDYRLDRLPYWEDDTWHQFGTLPSSRDSLLLAMDANNSYDRRKTNEKHVISFQTKYTKDEDGKYQYFRIQAPLNFLNERLDYRSEAVNTDLQQKKFTFTPSVYAYLAWNNWERYVSFDYSLSMTMPDLYNMVDIRNDANPLSIRLGNPHLKMRTDHRMQTSFTRSWKQHNTTFNIGGGLRFFLNQVSQGYSYNTQTGVYTYQPQNVDGNWQTYFFSSFGIQPDKEKRLTLNNYIHGDYTRNVDYAMATNALTSEMPEVKTSLSHVNNWYLEDRLTLNYRYNDLYLGAQLYGQYRHANNKERTIEEINATDFSYGINGGYVFKYQSCPAWLKNLNINTDIKMYSRRGYGERSLNSDDLVWNASVSRPFCKGKILVNLEAFDILHQLSNTQIVINGQGRTETIRNTLPRYIMLHVTYKFQKIPKNREK